MCAQNQRAVAVENVGGLRSAQGDKDGAQLAPCGAQGIGKPGHVQGSDVDELVGQAQDQFAVDLGVAIEPVAAEQPGCIVDGAVERANPVGGAQGMVVGVIGLVSARPVPRVPENERGAPRGTPVAAFDCAKCVRVSRLGHELCRWHGALEEVVFTIRIEHGHAAGVSSPDLAAHQQAGEDRLEDCDFGVGPPFLPENQSRLSAHDSIPFVSGAKPRKMPAEYSR